MTDPATPADLTAARDGVLAWKATEPHPFVCDTCGMGPTTANHLRYNAMNTPPEAPPPVATADAKNLIFAYERRLLTAIDAWYEDNDAEFEDLFEPIEQLRWARREAERLVEARARFTERLTGP